MTPEDPAFRDLAAEIRSCPYPFGTPPAERLERAAVLVNRSGRAIVALGYIWRYTAADGRTTTHSHTNLGSSIQRDVLAGRAGIARDRYGFILPESQRLITEEGMFGDNADVLPPEAMRPGGGVRMGWAGGARRGGAGEEATAVELQLDVVFLEDGLCAGPDEFGLFASVTEDLERQRDAAQEIVEVLRNGGIAGQVFEILRPLARHAPPGAEARRRGRHAAQLLAMFANMAINLLVNGSDTELPEGFDRAAQAQPLRLRRAAPAGELQ